MPSYVLLFRLKVSMQFNYSGWLTDWIKSPCCIYPLILQMVNSLQICLLKESIGQLGIVYLGRGLTDFFNFIDWRDYSIVDSSGDAGHNRWSLLPDVMLRTWWVRTGSLKHSRFLAISLNMSGFDSTYAYCPLPWWVKHRFACQEAVDRYVPRYATLNWASDSSVRCIHRLVSPVSELLLQICAVCCIDQ